MASAHTRACHDHFEYSLAPRTVYCDGIRAVLESFDFSPAWSAHAHTYQVRRTGPTRGVGIARHVPGLGLARAALRPGRAGRLCTARRPPARRIWLSASLVCAAPDG